MTAASSPILAAPSESLPRVTHSITRCASAAFKNQGVDPERVRSKFAEDTAEDNTLQKVIKPISVVQSGNYMPSLHYQFISVLSIIAGLLFRGNRITMPKGLKTCYALETV